MSHHDARYRRLIKKQRQNRQQHRTATPAEQEAAVARAVVQDETRPACPLCHQVLTSQDDRDHNVRPVQLNGKWIACHDVCPGEVK
jgi:hypothetical protein